jgi:hypothetical protein
MAIAAGLGAEHEAVEVVAAEALRNLGQKILQGQIFSFVQVLNHA